jgi:class 3 adenylate cyclase
MGMAHLRSRILGSRAFQLAVWNGKNTGTSAGTVGAMRRWESVGMENKVILTPEPRSAGAEPQPENPLEKLILSRQMKAMIFADVKGFSSLQERHLPEFVPRWMDALDQLRQAHANNIHYINTWGDAAYLVLDNAPGAARVALQMASLFDQWDLEAMGLPTTLGLRVAAHVGPVFETHNPLLNRPDFFGPHVNQTARLEPCTPVGSVYVTEPFAAAVSLEGKGQYRCEYVGNHPLPKNFGRIRMYHLTENISDDS